MSFLIAVLRTSSVRSSAAELAAASCPSIFSRNLYLPVAYGYLLSCTEVKISIVIHMYGKYVSRALPCQYATEGSYMQLKTLNS